VLCPRDLRVEVALVRERCRGDHADPTREESVARVREGLVESEHAGAWQRQGQGRVKRVALKGSSKRRPPAPKTQSTKMSPVSTLLTGTVSLLRDRPAM